MAHVGDSTQLGCVLQSTGEKRMTKVDWTFSSGEHAEVQDHCCAVEAPGGWRQDGVGAGGIGAAGAVRWCCRAWASELVRTGPQLSHLAVGNFSFLVGKMALMQMRKRRRMILLLLLLPAQLLGPWGRMY